MKLMEAADVAIWPLTHYVFIEKIGPFSENAPRAWQEFNAIKGSILAKNKPVGVLSLYKPDPKRMVYRAGVALAAVAVDLPPGASYEVFPGGRYRRFTLTGSYSQLPAATSQVFATVKEKGYPPRNDFCIEHYANDPATTPEKDLITEIFVPTT